MAITLDDIDQALQQAQPPSGLSPQALEAAQRRALTSEYAGFLPGGEALQALGLVSPERQHAVTEAIPGMARTGAGMALGTGATAAGAALGTAAAPFLGPLAPAAPAAGATLGSLAGRKANVALGLEEPGIVGDVLSLTPVVGPALGAAGRGLLKRLPGVGGGMHEAARETLEQVPGRLRPTEQAAPMYQALEAQNPAVSLGPVQRVAQEIVQSERALPASVREGTLTRLSEELDVLAKTGDVPFAVVHRTMQRIGELVGEAQRSASPALGGLKRLYGAMYEAMDAADIPLLRQANAITRRNYAVDDLATLFRPGSPGMVTRPDGLVQVHGGKLLDRFQKLVDDKLFRESFTAAERAEIAQTIKTTFGLPRLPPPGGASYGSGGVIGRGSLAGAAAAGMTGSAEVGATVGMVTMAAEYAIPQLLMTKPGRAFVQHVLRDKSGIGAGEAQQLLAAVRALGFAPSEPATE